MCSILLFLTVVNLLLCLIYKLNFIIDVYVQEKTVLDIQGWVPLVVPGIHWEWMRLSFKMLSSIIWKQIVHWKPGGQPGSI
jgi:hypothetical protein